MINKHGINRAYEISKICSIGSFTVLIPFLAYGIWSGAARYSEPIFRVFHEVKFRVSGSAKSPPTIVVSGSEGKVFFSDCNGLKKLVCDDEKYWKAWHTARQIEVIEIASKRGIIKSISMDTGITMSIDNAEIKAWLAGGERTQWQGIYGLSIVFFLSTAFLAIFRYLQSTISEGE